jgi:hypothetical protein
MKNYQVREEDGYITLEENGIILTIPNNPANTDYQRYLRWLENPDADEFNVEDYA